MVIVLRECRMGDFHNNVESIYLPNEMLEPACIIYFMVDGRVEECTIAVAKSTSLDYLY